MSASGIVNEGSDASLGQVDRGHDERCAWFFSARYRLAICESRVHRCRRAITKGLVASGRAFCDLLKIIDSLACPGTLRPAVLDFASCSNLQASLRRAHVWFLETVEKAKDCEIVDRNNG